MPFTPAHVAAMIPLRGAKALPFAALAVGAMVPDFYYYLPGSWTPSPNTHSMAGLLTWDLLVGVVLWLAWRWAAPALHDSAPTFVRSRWQPRPWAGGWHMVILAILIGAISHVAWDEFTHPGRWGVHHIAFLAATWGPLPGYKWAQYASGVGGLSALAWAGWHTPTRPVPERRVPVFATLTPAVVLGAGALVALVSTAGMLGSATLERIAFVAVTTGVAGAALACAVMCVAHRVSVRSLVGD